MRPSGSTWATTMRIAFEPMSIAATIRASLLSGDRVHIDFDPWRPRERIVPFRGPQSNSAGFAADSPSPLSVFSRLVTLAQGARIVASAFFLTGGGRLR